MDVQPSSRFLHQIQWKLEEEIQPVKVAFNDCSLDRVAQKLQFFLINSTVMLRSVEYASVIQGHGVEIGTQRRIHKHPRITCPKILPRAKMRNQGLAQVLSEVRKAPGHHESAATRLLHLLVVVVG